MKAYLNNGCISWLEDADAPAEYEMAWDLTDVQAEFLRNGATCQLQEGRLVVVPAAVEVVEPVSAGLTKLEFMNRFTDQELAGIYTAAKSSVAVEIWLAKFNATAPDEDGHSVFVNDPRTIESIQMLEAAGLIAAGRAAEILS